ncbi:hypothetical protein [Paraburkholderia strydomiana]|uniref:Uncharacterized protein n=1 Tax=Paraburkholderia strydomiana TaxID=1245417 RepID=A0ABW9BTD8_9BURK
MKIRQCEEVDFEAVTFSSMRPDISIVSSPKLRLPVPSEQQMLVQIFLAIFDREFLRRNASVRVRRQRKGCASSGPLRRAWSFLRRRARVDIARCRSHPSTRFGAVRIRTQRNSRHESPRECYQWLLCEIRWAAGLVR